MHVGTKEDNIADKSAGLSGFITSNVPFEVINKIIL